jgi:hypothetical protein
VSCSSFPFSHRAVETALARQESSFQRLTWLILEWPSNASSAPWSSTPSLDRLLARRFELSERALVQVEKARNWFNRAITLNPDIGDFWAQYYKFECQHGTKQQQEDLLTKAKSVESRHGEYWYVHSRASR